MAQQTTTTKQATEKKQPGDYLQTEDDKPIALDSKTNANMEKNFYADYINTGSAKYHKSLDFSNVGLYDGENNDPTGLGKQYRQFHQTRIYIQGKDSFQGVYGHGARNKEGTYVISANLPVLVNYRIGSDWTNPLSGLGGPLMSTMAGLLKSTLSPGEIQGLIPSSLYSRFQTVQMWNGSKPLNMSITIPVIDDGLSAGKTETNRTNSSHANFAEALEFLGSLCLPNIVDRNNKGTSGPADSFGFYTPPPSPLKIQAFWTGRTKKNDGWEKKGPINFVNANYARIMIQLGGMLLIDNCVITSINVQYNNTKSLIRHSYTANQNNGNTLDYLLPMTAELTINFSTIEAITAKDYSKMLWLHRQADMGSGTVSSVGFQQLIGQKIGTDSTPTSNTNGEGN